MELNKILVGDCLIKLKELEDNSIDSIVTDPPYELGFMGKAWDNTGIANNPLMWKECLRVLKPGGYLLSFGGTRTYHRMAVAIEDAGFEVRDMIEWCYGSGFPKSLNIGKAVDKQDTVEFRKEIGSIIKDARNKKGLTMDGLCDLLELNNEGHGGMVNHYENGRATPTVELWLKICEVLGIDSEIDYIKEKTERLKIIGETITNKTVYQNIGGKNESGKIDVTEPKSELGKQWEGWGTALKPAHEPICMARKPLAEKTVAENVLKYGTGGINIDESRVGTEEMKFTKASSLGNNLNMEGGKAQEDYVGEDKIGRFPANLIHDNSEEVRECFPEARSSMTASKTDKKYVAGKDSLFGGQSSTFYSDSGNASRFFKSIPIEEQDEIQEECTDMEEKLEKLDFLPEAAKSIIYKAKASKSERNKGCEDMEEKLETITPNNPSCAICGGNKYDRKNGMSVCICENPEWNKTLDKPNANHHPTVKPIALMEYLIKMVTPKGGVVLDCFAGSGSTLVAAKQNGFQYVGIEMTPEYIPIIEARLNAVEGDIQPILPL